LDDAWKIALAEYPGISTKDAAIQAAVFNKKYATSHRLPTISMQLQSNYGTFNSTSGAFFPLPGFFNVNATALNSDDHHLAGSTFGSLTFNWNVFQFGRQRKFEQMAAINLDRSKKDMESYKIGLKTQVTRLYVDLLYKKSALKWTSENAARVKEILEIAKSLADAGLKPGADTSLVASSFFQLAANEEDWKGKEIASKDQLGAYLKDLDTDFELNIQPFLSGAGSYIGLSTSDSLKNHPYLTTLATDVQYKKAQSNMYQQSAYPSLSILGGGSVRGTSINHAGFNTGKWQDSFNNGAGNYLFGIGLVWNISGIHQNNLQRQQFRQEAIAAQSIYDKKALNLRALRKANQAQLIQKTKQLAKTTIGIAKANEAFQLYLTRYETGVINLTELLQIQHLLQQAEKAHLDASHAFWLKVIEGTELSGNFSHLSQIF